MRFSDRINILGQHLSNWLEYGIGYLRSINQDLKLSDTVQKTQELFLIKSKEVRPRPLLPTVKRLNLASELVRTNPRQLRFNKSIYTALVVESSVRHLLQFNFKLWPTGRPKYNNISQFRRVEVAQPNFQHGTKLQGAKD